MIVKLRAQSHRYPSDERILAIDPTSRGFGFAVLEIPDRLIDWGIVHVQRDNQRNCLYRIEQLIDSYEPAIMVLEDTLDKRSRRCRRVHRLLGAMKKLARSRGLKLRSIPTRQVHQVFIPLIRRTKYRIAQVVADRFPQLRPHLPKPRKLWTSEDERLAIFDALAFALAYMGQDANGSAMESSG